MLIGIAALHGIGNDFQNGDLKGLALQTYKSTTTIVKHTTDDSGASTAILTTKAEIKGAISSISAKYGISYDQFFNTIKGESSFNPQAIGPGGISKGVAQFTLPTWLGNCSNKDERFDAYKSLECAAKLWAKGQSFRWDCWCQLYGAGDKNCQKRGFK